MLVVHQMDNSQQSESNFKYLDTKIQEIEGVFEQGAKVRYTRHLPPRLNIYKNNGTQVQQRFTYHLALHSGGLLSNFILGNNIYFILINEKARYALASMSNQTAYCHSQSFVPRISLKNIRDMTNNSEDNSLENKCIAMRQHDWFSQQGITIANFTNKSNFQIFLKRFVSCAHTYEYV